MMRNGDSLKSALEMDGRCAGDTGECMMIVKVDHAGNDRGDDGDQPSAVMTADVPSWRSELASLAER